MKGVPNPKREVECIHCGVKLMRATYFNRASCVPCRTKNWARNYAKQKKKIRSQARRYRILTHILGWPDTEEGFADMLEEIKQSPMAFRKRIECRLIKRDVFYERRAAR